MTTELCAAAMSLVSTMIDVMKEYDGQEMNEENQKEMLWRLRKLLQLEDANRIKKYVNGSKS